MSSLVWLGFSLFSSARPDPLSDLSFPPAYTWPLLMFPHPRHFPRECPACSLEEVAIYEYRCHVEQRILRSPNHQLSLGESCHCCVTERGDIGWDVPSLNLVRKKRVVGEGYSLSLYRLLGRCLSQKEKQPTQGTMELLLGSRIVFLYHQLLDGRTRRVS